MHRAAPTALIAAVAVLVASPATALTTRTDTVRATVKKSGRSGTALVYKGTVRSKVFGRGTVVEKVYGDLSGTFVITYEKGTVRGSSQAKAKAAPGGGLDVSGSYKLTGGTGRYKDVRGKGRFTGHSSTDLQTATFRQHGKVSF
jgi:hypothetical protein